MGKQALLSVTFGTSYEETREKTIDAVDARLREDFSDRAFYSAWTSGRIIAKVASQRNEHHDSLDEAFARMSADGVDDVIVATMCLMRGGEWGKIASALDAWLREGDGRIARLAEPLLASESDQRSIACCLRDEYSHVGTDEALLLMGHGSTVARNDAYAGVRQQLVALGCDRFYIATVEGEPTLDDVIDDLISSNPTCVHLAPLMMVAGDHASNDLAGSGTESWQSVLQRHGLQTRVTLRGLGEFEGVKHLVCEHAHEALPVK